MKELAHSRGFIFRTKLLMSAKYLIDKGEKQNFSGQSESSPSLLVPETIASTSKQWKEIIVSLSGPVETTQASFISVFWTRATRDGSWLGHIPNICWVLT